MEFIGEIFIILVISYILSAIISTISSMQFEKFLKNIGMSKYCEKKKSFLLNKEYDTEETKLYDKYNTKALIYTTIFIFISLLLLNINYHIIDI